MDWLDNLKHETQSLYTHIMALKNTYQPSNDKQKFYLTKLLTEGKWFHQWVEGLPDDFAMWRWVGQEAIDLQATSERYLERLANIKMKVLLMFPGQMRLTPTAVILQRSIDAIAPILEQSAADTVHMSSVPLQIFEPRLVLATLVPFLYPALIDPPPTSLDVRDWPSVQYHPYHTRSLLSNIINVLSLKPSTNMTTTGFRMPGVSRFAPEIVHLAAHQTSDFFELHFSIQSLYLTPARWDTMIDQFESHMLSTSIERLHEFGGDIAPLTWDEGYGQGVIVRLPWADI